MSEASATATSVAAQPTGNRDRFDQVISRIAAGDRAAFRSLYAFMAMRVWQIVHDTQLGPANVRAVIRSTFVEVWHSAGAAARYDARDWLATIAHRRVNDRLRLIAATGRAAVAPAQAGLAADAENESPTVADYDTGVRRELAVLLGTGPATIRTGRGVFVRINDLDHALATIAATTGPARDLPYSSVAPEPFIPPSARQR
jgi:hypothetical protein